MLTKLLFKPFTLILVAAGLFLYYLLAPQTASAIASGMDKSTRNSIYTGVETIDDGTIIPVTTGTSIDHALKHGAEVVAAVEVCINKQHPDITYAKENNKRVELCLLPEGGTGIRVSALKDGQWQRITSFINDNIKNINDCIGFADEDMGRDGVYTYIKDCWKSLFSENAPIIR